MGVLGQEGNHICHMCKQHIPLPGIASDQASSGSVSKGVPTLCPSEVSRQLFCLDVCSERSAGPDALSDREVRALTWQQLGAGQKVGQPPAAE